MVMTDSIADMLNRIKNASNAFLDSVDMDSSNIKVALTEILKREGFIKNFRIIEEKNKKALRIYLRYGGKRERVINGIRRVSKPSRRIYSKHDNLPYVLNGYGIAIVSTSSGILTGKECRRRRIGGEVLCYVW